MGGIKKFTMSYRKTAAPLIFRKNSLNKKNRNAIKNKKMIGKHYKNTMKID